MELVVELFKVLKDFLHLGSGTHKVCKSEVVSTFLLAEATSGDCHDAGVVDKLHAVDEVRLLSLGEGAINEFLREVNSWEAVHCTFDCCASDLLHITERVFEQLSPLLHTFEDMIGLFRIQVDTLFGFSCWLRWIDHQVSGNLTWSVGTELY